MAGSDAFLNKKIVTGIAFFSFTSQIGQYKVASTKWLVKNKTKKCNKTRKLLCDTITKICSNKNG